MRKTTRKDSAVRKAAKAGKLRFAFFGAGYWARFQMAAWREVEGAECVALYNRTQAKGEAFAQEFGIPKVYDDPEELLRSEKLDFVDLCTNPFTLPRFVKLAVSFKVPVISQKPMAPSVAVGEELVKACANAGIPYYIHENWRWQRQLRQFKCVLDSGEIGTPFRARITHVSGHPVFINEPTLVDLENFILTDMGTHILDIARFYFGEPERLYCQTHRVHPDIKGEDVATVMLLANGGKTTITCDMAYAENYYEHDVWPQSLVFVEGDRGSAEVAADYWIRVTTRDGTCSRRYPPVSYRWANPDHRAVEASIVTCHSSFLRALRGQGEAETTGVDNLKTLKLVYACYESARSGAVVEVG
jgi:predicted dehydrogenase